MRTTSHLLPIALSAILTTAPALAASPQKPRTTLPSLDATEASFLSFMREEEKLARDMYLTLNVVSPSALFENIAQSEQQHMDAVKKALDKYGLPDPADQNIGVFNDLELQELYVDLLGQGEASYLEALRVGGLIEEVDIEDNQNALDATDNADLKTLYGNLLRGSRNHLRAYAAEIERLGVVYEAQHLDQATVDAIIDSPMERGTAAKTGKGRGRQ